MTSTAVSALRARFAAWHELALHGFAQPALPLLLSAGPLVRPLRHLPKLGWLIADAQLAVRIHGDTDNFSIINDGASGHWWAQMLGDQVLELFEGPEHLKFRSTVHELFTTRRSADLVERAVGPMLLQLRADLAVRNRVDIAEFSRIFTGRIMVEFVGLPADTDSDAPYLELFDTVERLANLAKGSWATTVVPARNIRKGRALAERIGAGVADAYASSDPTTMIGRCRDAGLSLEQTRAMSVLFVVAGTATLASTMGRLVALLHDTGSQHLLLESPDLTNAAIREGLRVTSSMPIVGRAVARDTELAGRLLRAGDRVKIMTWSIDTTVGGFDLTHGRIPMTRQLWFGGGRHFCLGAALTHAELSAFLEALIAAGRPWRIVRRRYRCNVFVPLYKRLDIELV